MFNPIKAIRICDSSAEVCSRSSILWEETRAIKVDDGLFAVTLGGEKPLGASVFSGRRQHLEIQIKAEPLSPARRLVAAPKALRGAAADSVHPADENSIHAPGKLSSESFEVIGIVGPTPYGWAAQEANNFRNTPPPVAFFGEELIYFDAVKNVFKLLGDESGYAPLVVDVQVCDQESAHFCGMLF